MNVDQLTNLPASVKQRLLNLSRQTQIEFNVLLTKYALERFLYRMSMSRSRSHFILKGALLFGAWTKELHRTTSDADLLNLQPPSLERLASVFQEICKIQVVPDGIHFLPESVQGQEIRRQNFFGGIRINLMGVLGKAKVPIQIDIGFGDACVPPARIISFPVLLDFPTPRLRACARETMIAEKFHAAVALGMGNSRMKDYFDIYYLSQKFDFKGENLSQALIATFDRQKTPIPERTPRGLSTDFAIEPMKRAQWNHFLIQKNVMSLEKDFSEVVESVRKFLMPAARAAAKGESFDKRWPSGGPWRPQEKNHDG